jgi:hypothetical protein
VIKVAIIRAPLQRTQIGPLPEDSVLRFKDANCSVAANRVKRVRTDKTEFRNAYKSQYGRPPPPSPPQVNLPANDAEMSITG